MTNVVVRASDTDTSRKEAREMDLAPDPRELAVRGQCRCDGGLVDKQSYSKTWPAANGSVIYSTFVQNCKHTAQC